MNRTIWLAVLIGATIIPAIARNPPAPNPSADEIIEKLARKPESGSEALTRGLRNLQPTERMIALDILFAYDSSVVLADGKSALDQLALALLSQRLLDQRFVVEGHTDAKGTEQYNFLLSERRAAAVVRYLTEHGIAEQRLSAVGKGFSDLRNKENPMAAENRRVRIRAVPTEPAH